MGDLIILAHGRPPDRRESRRPAHYGADLQKSDLGKAVNLKLKAEQLGVQGNHPGWRVIRRGRPAVFIALLSDALAEASGWRHR